MFVGFVTHLLILLTPFPFAIEAADTFVVLVYHAALLRTIQRLGIFLLRVQWGTEAHELKHILGFQKALFVPAHQVVLHLDAGRNAPTMAGYQPEHIAETVHHESLVLLPCIARTKYTLAHHVVSIVGMYALFRIFQFACQIYVVHRDLTQ